MLEQLKKLGHAGGQCMSRGSGVACRWFPRALLSPRTSPGRLWLGSSSVLVLNAGDKVVGGGLTLSSFRSD